MPITVEKSPLVELDSETTTALQQVVDRLEVQSKNVKKLSVLANFSIDRLASLQHGTTIAQGLVVQVAKDYVLGVQDKIWFHPDIGTGRTVFEIENIVVPSKFSKVELDGVLSSIGEYSVSQPDEFGCETVQRHLIVDTSVTASLQGLYNKWLSNCVAAGEVDKQWKRMKFGDLYGIRPAVEKMRQDMVQGIVSNPKVLYSDEVRSVFSDTASIYFTNNAVKKSESESDILIKSSALGGYRMYTTSNESILFYPATLGCANQYYSWDKMSAKNCQRIEKSCMWDGELAFNAVVMRPPSIIGSNIRKMEDEYDMSFRDTIQMNAAKFSGSDSIRDNISPSEVYHLEPSSQYISKGRDFISAPVSMQHPILHNLMNDIQSIQERFPEFQIFNPKLLQNGRLKIPKEIYKQLA